MVLELIFNGNQGFTGSDQDRTRTEIWGQIGLGPTIKMRKPGSKNFLKLRTGPNRDQKTENLGPIWVARSFDLAVPESLVENNPTQI